MKKIKGKIQYNSPVVLTFALISLAALILNYLTAGISNKLLFSVYRSPLTSPLTYVRLFTHIFGHANLTHYVNNMMLFLLLGPIIEEKYGSTNLVIMIAITAAVTGILNNILFSSGLLGASGIVFCFIILSSMTSVKNGKIPVTLILVCILYMGQEILGAVFVKDNISQFAHIIGGVCGGAFGYLTPKFSKK